MRVIIIGSGNVATIFAQRLFENNVKIEQIIARNPIAGNSLAATVNSVSTNIENIQKDADIYIISVQDDSLPDVIQQLQNTIPATALVVHTTGSASIQLLDKIASQYGVLYPLQSIRKEKNKDLSIPLFLDGNNQVALDKIETLAKKISPIIDYANDEQRIKLHIAAVFVSNFTNYLYSVAEKFCTNNQLNFSHLLPLMEETVNRLHTHSAASVQTGPAARGDRSTIEKHLSILQKENPEMVEVYNFLTNEILHSKS